MGGRETAAACLIIRFISILQDKTVLVVGGGAVACRNSSTLLEYGAIVKIVSPGWWTNCKPWSMRNNVSGLPGLTPPRTSGARSGLLLYGKREVNARVAGDAQAQNVPVNVVVDPDKCSFLVPSILKRVRDLSIAVFHRRQQPKVAGLIRRQLEEIYGNEMAVYLALLRTWRQEIKNSLPSEKRPALLGEGTLTAGFWNISKTDSWIRRKR